MLWFLSDCHYGHRNIVRGESQWTDKSGCRDFDTLDNHNEYLIRLINEHVMPNDSLIHLGDWAFGGERNIRLFRDRLNVNHIDVLIGNHDHHIKKHGAHKYGFERLDGYRELVSSSVAVVLCHYPIEYWNGMESGSLHLHGHVHGQGTTRAGRYDVGVDAMGLINMDTVATLPTSTTMRHASLEGGSKFAF